MPRILYISYDGMSEPLGEAQVLEYLCILASSHDVTLISFEKPGQDSGKREALARRVHEAGIRWIPLRYHKRFKLLSAMVDLTTGVLAGLWAAWTRRIDIIHARSYLPALMGLLIKCLSGARLIFDIRGFWPDQRADCGAWSRSQTNYKLAKAAERILFRHCDGVVSLTAAALEKIERFPYMTGRMPPADVIPTCVNLAVFHPGGRGPRTGGPVIGFMGNATFWYRLSDMARGFLEIRKRRPGASLLVVNRDDHALIRTVLSAHLPDLSSVEFASADYGGVAPLLRRMDGAIFFLKEAPSMAAVCPTRLGEFLACGVPVLTNGGYGDARAILQDSGAGVTVDDMEALPAGAEEFLRILESPDAGRLCRELAERRFSLSDGVSRYSRLYARLTPSRDDAGEAAATPGR